MKFIVKSLRVQDLGQTFGFRTDSLRLLFAKMVYLWWTLAYMTHISHPPVKGLWSWLEPAKQMVLSCPPSAGVGGSLVTSLTLPAQKPAVAAMFSAGRAGLPCGSCVCVCVRALRKEVDLELYSFLVGFENSWFPLRRVWNHAGRSAIGWYGILFMFRAAARSAKALEARSLSLGF